MEFMPGYDGNEHDLWEGLLKKKSPKGLVKVWQDRWVKLTNKNLRYYKNKHSVEQGLIPVCYIATITCDPENLKRQRFRFDIQIHEKFGGRVFSFIAKTEADCLKWVEKLRHAHAAYDGDHATDADGNAVDPSSGWSASSKVKMVKPVSAGLSVTEGGFAAAYANYGCKTALVPPAKKPFALTDQSLCQALFGRFKLRHQEDASDLGATFVIGDDSYPVTHSSFLIHTVAANQPFYEPTVDALSRLPALSAACPALSRVIYQGATSDSSFVLFHPALEVRKHSLSRWLDDGLTLSPEAVAYVGAVLISTLEAIHAQGYNFTMLSVENVFFDAEGNVRVHDIAIPLPAALCPINIESYTPPEVAELGSVVAGRQAGRDTAKADFWRLGALLYEAVTCAQHVRINRNKVVPPEQQEQMTEDEIDAIVTDALLAKIAKFTPADLQFAPSVPADLRDLIGRLLDPNPVTRLSDFAALKRHAVFAPLIAGRSWDCATLLAEVPKPDWVVEHVVDRLKDPQYETPMNLTLEPAPVKMQRVSLAILSARGLPAGATERVYCAASLEGDIWKTSVQAKAPLVWNEQNTFDIFGATDALPTSEIVIEVLSKKLELEGSNPLVGVAAVPVATIRCCDWSDQIPLTVLDPKGLPIGELLVQVQWQEIPFDLASGVLQPLSQPDKSFAQVFAPPSSDQRFLWALIVDPALLRLDPDQAPVAPIAPVAPPLPGSQQQMPVSSPTMSAARAPPGMLPHPLPVRPIPPPTPSSAASPGAGSGPPPFPGGGYTVRGASASTSSSYGNGGLNGMFGTAPGAQPLPGMAGQGGGALAPPTPGAVRRTSNPPDRYSPSGTGSAAAAASPLSPLSLAPQSSFGSVGSGAGGPPVGPPLLTGAALGGRPAGGSVAPPPRPGMLTATATQNGAGGVMSPPSSGTGGVRAPPAFFAPPGSIPGRPSQPLPPGRLSAASSSASAASVAVPLPLPPAPESGPSPFDARAPTWSPPTPLTVCASGPAAGAGPAGVLSPSGPVPLPPPFNPALEAARARERQESQAAQKQRAAQQQAALVAQQAQAAGVDPEQVGAYWRATRCEQSGDTYYYNRVTRTTTWDVPQCFVEHQAAQAQAGH